ncbi:ribonuclease H-like domain-containing protein [Rhypophila decipiens]|uniref:ribonuclease H n=1 Tax=Rhypophila decipiens TaxID=261697 RepID=A0AAN6Y6X6_9PEZI|nr:ribonuclease H-like domain-containing protein [Rhypophila decipiens]
MEQCDLDLWWVGEYGFVHAPSSCPGASESDKCRCCGRPPLHTSSIVVAVDGVRPDNGGNANKSGCGVYFGDRAAEKHNLRWRVPDDFDCRHTSQRAVLHAAIQAPEPFFAVVRVGGQRPGIYCWANHIIVRSDLAYLVEGITRHASKWIQNGWMTAHGKPAANRQLWKVLIEYSLRILEGLGRWVDFWLVKREHNTDAHHLANRALKRAHSPTSLYRISSRSFPPCSLYSPTVMTLPLAAEMHQWSTSESSRGLQ